MIQKIIKVGNSAAVTLPKDFLKKSNFRIGQEVAVETNPEMGIVVVKFKNRQKDRPLNLEFEEWLEDFTKESNNLLKKLARSYYSSQRKSRSRKTRR